MTDKNIMQNLMVTNPSQYSEYPVFFFKMEEHHCLCLLAAHWLPLTHKT